MNKNFILYDTYTVKFDELKNRSIVKEYYMLNEQDQTLKIVCDQSINADIDGSPELISELHCINKKYKSNTLLSSSINNSKVYFQLQDVIPLNQSKNYTFRLLDSSGNSYKCKEGIVITFTFTEN